MKKFFEVVVNQIRTKIVQTCAENTQEAMDWADDQVTSGIVKLGVNDIVATDASDAWEIKPTEAEIKEVKDWASNMVGLMSMEDTEYVYRTATREDVAKSFSEWVAEGMEIPKYADADDIWQEIIAIRKTQEDPTPEQFDQICDVQDSVEHLLRIMLKKDGEDVHQMAMEMADTISELLVMRKETVYYPTHTEKEGWGDTFPSN